MNEQNKPESPQDGGTDDIEIACLTCNHRYVPDLIDGVETGCPKCLADFLQDGPDPTQTIDADAAFTPAATIGEVIGDYEILELLGRGGMGSVYKARQKKLARTVAIKILDAKLAKSAEFTSRFGREAKALALLNHPNVVQIYDYGHDGDRYYLVMEFVEGASLRHLMDTQKLTPDAALRYVRQICDALDYAHTEGIIHRDVKPDNILIDKYGNLKVADFGLAKIALKEGEAPMSHVTQADRVMGTPNYMAPEQRSQTATVDHRADIFSLGVVFYEMLTGDLPMGSFPPPSQSIQVNVHLDEVVLKAMNINPELRYQRASQIKAEVTEATEKAPSPTDSTPKTSAKLSKLAIWGVLLLPWGLPVVWEIIGSFREPFRGVRPPFLFSNAYHHFFLPFGIATALAATLIGWKALEQIHESKGRLRGRQLAILSLLSYPLITLLVFGAEVIPDLAGNGRLESVVATTTAVIAFVLLILGIRSARNHNYASGAPHRAIAIIFALMMVTGSAPFWFMGTRRILGKINSWSNYRDLPHLVNFVVAEEGSERLQKVALYRITNEINGAGKSAKDLLPVIDDLHRNIDIRKAAVDALGDPLSRDMIAELKKRVYDQGFDNEVRSKLAMSLFFQGGTKARDEMIRRRQEMPADAVSALAVQLLSGAVDSDGPTGEEVLIEVLENPQSYQNENAWSTVHSLLFYLDHERYSKKLKRPDLVLEALAVMEKQWLNAFDGPFDDSIRDDLADVRVTLNKIITNRK